MEEKKERLFQKWEVEQEKLSCHYRPELSSYAYFRAEIECPKTSRWRGYEVTLYQMIHKPPTHHKTRLIAKVEGVPSIWDGVLHTTVTTKVTGKGQVYFVNKFLEEKELSAII